MDLPSHNVSLMLLADWPTTLRKLFQDWREIGGRFASSVSFAIGQIRKRNGEQR